ncbi:hypothetical protein [Paracoccus gahaiensis]|nr:hypothetical protein [Paracoccus gahaiensis]
MFDIQTEAYLRRSQANQTATGAAPIIPVAIATSLVLWVTGLLIAF